MPFRLPSPPVEICDGNRDSNIFPMSLHVHVSLFSQQISDRTVKPSDIFKSSYSYFCYFCGGETQHKLRHGNRLSVQSEAPGAFAAVRPSPPSVSRAFQHPRALYPAPPPHSKHVLSLLSAVAGMTLGAVPDSHGARVAAGPCSRWPGCLLFKGLQFGGWLS